MPTGADTLVAEVSRSQQCVRSPVGAGSTIKRIAKWPRDSRGGGKKHWIGFQVTQKAARRRRCGQGHGSKWSGQARRKSSAPAAHNQVVMKGCVKWKKVRRRATQYSINQQKHHRPNQPKSEESCSLPRRRLSRITSPRQNHPGRSSCPTKGIGHGSQKNS